MVMMLVALSGTHEPVERPREAVDAHVHWAVTREEAAWPVVDELGLALESAVGTVHVWQICVYVVGVLDELKINN